MTSSAWEDHPTPAQISPPNSYRPDKSYVPRDHGSGKKFHDDHGGGGDGYASPPSAPRDYSDQGSVKGYGSGVKSYGSVPSSNAHSHPSSLKDFANDHYGSVGGDHVVDDHVSTRFSDSHHGSIKNFGSDNGRGRNNADTRGSSDYGHGGHYGGDNGSDEANFFTNYNPKDYVRTGMSWLDRRSFHIGEPCAVPLDWDHHPILRQVPPDEHNSYRHTKLEEWLSTAHKRKLKENFGAYVWRASALANTELRHRKKQCWGDEYVDPLDRFVMRLFYGMKLKLERTESVVLGIDEETFILDILREECEELSKSGQLPVDQRSIQYTPLIISEMQERASTGGY